MESKALKKLMTGLKELDIPAKYEPSIDWDTEDDTIIISPKLHIQIGTSYMCIVKVVEDVGFDFSQEYQTVKAVLNNVKKLYEKNK